MNGNNTRRMGRILLGAAGVAATLGALPACQSPLQLDSQDRSSYNYANAVLARHIVDQPATGAAVPMQSPTVNLGIRIDDGTAPDTPINRIAPIHEYATTRPGTLGQAENVIRISLQDTISRALAHSLAIKVEAYNPAIREAQITEALAQFDPVLFAQSQFNNQDQPFSSLSGANGINWTSQLGVRKPLPSGGTAQVSVGDIYRDLTVAPFGAPKSSHQANINLALSQPLLRGFGANVNQANIYLAQRDRSIALATFRRQVITTVATVEEAYYTLMQAAVVVDIQERLFQGTKNTYLRIRDRWLIDADLIQIKQAQSAFESRQADLIRAKSNLRTASDRVKALLNDPDLDLRANYLLLPSDRPTDAPISFNVADQIDTALRYRTELQESRLQIERADIVINVARNDLLPRADVQVSVQSNGIDNGFDQAFTSTFDAPKYIDYAAGLVRFEMSIGNEAAEAVLKRRILERRQAVTQMLNNAQQVILDVKSQLRDLLTSYSEIQARQSARVAAGEQLNAIIQRELVERLTPEFLNLKLQAQAQLAQAEFDELQALVNYNLALMRLEQAKGTLLEYNRIAIGPAPVEDKDAGKIRLLGTSFQVFDK